MRRRLRRLVIYCVVVAVISAGGWGLNTWYRHTHCTMILGREVCGIDRYLPMAPDF
jgi:hypothetical protein